LKIRCLPCLASPSSIHGSGRALRQTDFWHPSRGHWKKSKSNVMNNLEILNARELSHEEMQTTNGGILFLLFFAAGMALAYYEERIADNE
jgi:hypothetical protein